MVEAAGVELDANSETGLIRRISAEIELLKSPESLNCSRAGTKQVQRHRSFAFAERSWRGRRFLLEHVS
jgi:hypothetical protein